MISGIFGAVLALLILIVYPIVSQKSVTQLEQIEDRGFIRFLTLNSASTYYQGVNQASGFEYQLGLLFAQSIGVEAQFITVSNFADLYPELLFGSGDITAAGLSINESSLSHAVVYGPRYHEVKNQVLYRKGNVDRPRTIDDLSAGKLAVIGGTSRAKLLRELQGRYPKLSWIESEDIGSEELIEMVENGRFDFALVDSHELALQRRFFPELRIAFELGRPRQLRWAFNHADDDSLALAIENFFTTIKSDGRLEQLIHRHYSQVAGFNYSDIQTFTGHIRERLPEYEAVFRREAEKYNQDWRLLAAIGYQESLWKARAKSPTGVRGLMMLTQATARQMKVENRLDPQQSIRGGARYFARVLDRIPEHIIEPDRTWFALASYNVGFGHLEDARKITEANGDDPDKWIDVKKSLPLLARKKWYKKTKYGYARGWEPVIYVENIRKYYDYLVISELKVKRAAVAEEKRPENMIRPIAPSH
ncbi:MAG: membrane-bound lytic murein transglycosylase MltF [Gammaproteobacteria bacterium]|nr:membrane-bound lytic murein transglycosylase MltF [Gammaproteobacteria bacterium]